MATARQNEKKRLIAEEYQRLSAEHDQMLEQARRWGTTMRELGEGLVGRPHRVFIMRPEGYIATSSDDIVLPTSDLPTLPQVHQLAERIRRSRARLQELKNAVSALEN
jgi:hypothetical protein